jgi:hypothetical protein
MKSAAKALGGLTVIVGVYFGAYFLLMRPGFALDPKSKEIRFPSFFIFADSTRVPGDLSVYAAATHWLNYVYSPIDPLFRKEEIEKMKLYSLQK